MLAGSVPALKRSYAAPEASRLVEDLAASTIFAGLGWDDVATLARHAQSRNHKPLSEALSEGERARDLNVVVRGRFVVLLPSGQLHRHGAGAVVNLDSFVAGDCFGHGGLVGDVVAPASIIATEPSQVIAIPLAALRAHAGEDARVGRAIYRNLFEIQTRRLVALSG